MAVLVFPNIVKADFVIGGQYGEGALVKKGKIVGYHNSVAASYGRQAGVQAFGGGLLRGWSESGTRPVFKLVTGMSTGAFIAPFALLASDDNITIENFDTTITT
jgi:hypothetical protein